MEVHHHSHEGHGPKTWKNYFWEFLMLFLAVFCGFLAEYQLEHVIEHNREKEYISSMYEDVDFDISSIERILGEQKKLTLNIDTLMSQCFEFDSSPQSQALLYKKYRDLLTGVSPMKPTERTLAQLKNAGGMRLIRNKKAIEHIIAYDVMGKDISEQQRLMESVLLDIVNDSYGLFNFKYYMGNGFRAVAKDPVLLTEDNKKLIAFGSRIATYYGALLNQIDLMEKMKKSGQALQATLKKSYKIQSH